MLTVPTACRSQARKPLLGDEESGYVVISAAEFAAAASIPNLDAADMSPLWAHLQAPSSFNVPLCVVPHNACGAM